MDNNNWRAAQGVQIPGQPMGGESVAAAGMEGGDWRSELHPDSRQRIVNKIMETRKRHLPFSGGQEGLQELKKTAVSFEEKIYTAATSQSDYLRKISMKMLTMETESQNPLGNSLQSNPASGSTNPQDPASTDSSTQMGNAISGELQEEIYQKIKSMNEMYFPELNKMYQKMAAKLQQHGALPQQAKNDELEKLRFFNFMLERLMLFLRTNKNEIQSVHKDKIVAVEKQIVLILTIPKSRKPISSLQQGQLAQPHMHSMQQPQQQQPLIFASDYLRKISSKMLMMETNSQNPMGNSLQSNPASGSKSPQDPEEEEDEPEQEEEDEPEEEEEVEPDEEEPAEQEAEENEDEELESVITSDDE